jgi:hypothetical protein
VLPRRFQAMNPWQPPPLDSNDPSTIMVGLMQISGKLDLLIEDVAVIRELLEEDGEDDEIDSE